MGRWRLSLLALAGMLLAPANDAVAQSNEPVETTLPIPQPTIGPEAWSLDGLEKRAVEHNAILRRDLAQVESLRGSALQAGLYPNPRFDTGNPPVILAGKESQYNFGFQQEIVVGGKLKLDRAAAVQRVQQAQLIYEQDRFALLTSVRQQFFVTLAAQRRVEVHLSLLKVLAAALDSAKKLQKVGEASQIDFLLLSVDYRQVEMNLQRARALLEGDYKKLAAVVGAPGLVIGQLGGDLLRMPAEFDEAALHEYLSLLHTNVRIAELDVDRNQILLKRAQVEPYPNPTLGPAANLGLVPGNDQFWLNLTFTIPVWNLNQGNIQSARANVRSALEEITVLQNELHRRGADALSRHRAARKVVEQYRVQILPHTAQILKLTQEGMKAGVFDFPRYLQAQRAVVETNNSYIDALENLWTTAAEVAGLLQKEHFP
jgi:cobalt-zinc-cadmium efflux system outer membrane protein